MIGYPGKKIMNQFQKESAPGFKEMSEIYTEKGARVMKNKKLYKSVKDKKLCGVCAGVADYLDLDPTMVRIVWTLITMFWGTGLVLYIIAALVMDDNPDELSVSKYQ